MSDRFGLLQVPMAGPFGSPSTNAIGDPALDKLAAFLKAAINADVGPGWAAIHPGIVPPEVTAVPVVFARTHNPDDGEFTENKLPALFVWRDSITKALALTQEWERHESRIAVLWVPPPCDYEKSRFREPFRNAIAKAITLAIGAARHPAWVVPGDTDPKAASWGSFLIAQMNATQLYVVDAKPHPLTVQKVNHVQPYDTLLVTLELVEVDEPLYDGYDLLDHVEGTVSLGSPALSVASYTLKPSITGVSPPTGGVAGGTPIVVTGKQFWEDAHVGALTVTLGGIPCTSVAWVDETRISAVTPPHTAGVKTLQVTLPSGASALLASAFTYV